MKRSLFNVWLSIVFVIPILILSSCSSTDPAQKSKTDYEELPETELVEPLPGQPLQDDPQQSTSVPLARDSMKPAERKLKKLAEKYLNGILAGMNDDNYKQFSENMVYELKSTLTKHKFKVMAEQIEKKIGNYESRQFLGILKLGPFDTVLWKATFSSSKNDVLIRLTLGELDDKYKIFGIRFQ